MGKFFVGHVIYNGSKYFGFQVQADVPTIQEELNIALRKAYPNGNKRVHGASRTDRGVHSLGQVVKFLVPRNRPSNEVKKNINSFLPPDIKLIQLMRINPSFKVTKFTIDKEYLYYFSMSDSKYPFVVNVNKEFSINLSNLDIENMNNLSKVFLGKHDFSYFQYKSSVKGTKVRTILSIDIIKDDSFENEEIYYLKIRGNGFLKQMVRIIFFYIIELSVKKILTKDIEFLLSAPKDETIGIKNKIAPSRGLFLKKITYPKIEDKNQVPFVEDLENWKDYFPSFFL